MRGHCTAPVSGLGDSRRQGRDAEGQEVGMMGTEAMTPLRDTVAHGTQESGTVDLEFPPHLIMAWAQCSISVGLQVMTHAQGRWS